MGKYFEKSAISKELAERATFRAVERIEILKDVGAPAVIISKETERAKRLLLGFVKRLEREVDFQILIDKAKRSKQVGHA